MSYLPLLLDYIKSSMFAPVITTPPHQAFARRSYLFIRAAAASGRRRCSCRRRSPQTDPVRRGGGTVRLGTDSTDSTGGDSVCEQHGHAGGPRLQPVFSGAGER